jgi:hypothetical protein
MILLIDVMRGTRELTGDEVKVVTAKFSTIS